VEELFTSFELFFKTRWSLVVDELFTSFEFFFFFQYKVECGDVEVLFRELFTSFELF
jgi:hypothetical protein